MYGWIDETARFARDLDEPVEDASRQAGRGDGVTVLARLGEQKLRTAQVEAITAVLVVTLALRRHRHEQIAVTGPHSRTMLVLFDARHERDEGDRRDVFQVQYGEFGAPSRPALGVERPRPGVEIEPLGQRAHRIAGAFEFRSIRHGVVF